MKRRTNATFLKSSIGRYNPDRQPACLAVFLTSVRSAEVKVPDCGLPVKTQLVRSKWPWVNDGLNVLYQQLCDTVFGTSWHDPQSTRQVPGHISKGQTSIFHRSSSWKYRIHIISFETGVRRKPPPCSAWADSFASRHLGCVSVAEPSRFIESGSCL